ncbi:thioredoxin family protein [Aquimarina muelleri]|uniref:Thioredoxin domain-containing protein n=1 Tax=Aquimarina muelleri TaxID=279356 RepID=A0A918N1G0_9FLAO|nr:thioredoxin family protein [Aquimarina muelleri]MCX2761958.1 thioredoxin family protein [Aquimarina muelleri]GGX10670.1 hypothetical protein GCM10007384_10500 [Aquimarina muelleri]
MRKIILILLLVFLYTNVINAQEWRTNFDEAKKIAKNENKHIILVFAGSDWCAPCIKLEKKILATKEFKESVKNDFVLIKADFPRKKKNQLAEGLQNQNKKLAEKYNKSGGFPLVVVVDKNGEKLGEVGYENIPPNSYLDILNQMIK